MPNRRAFLVSMPILFALSLPFAAHAADRGQVGAVDAVLESYLKIQTALAADQTEGVKAAAGQLDKAAAKLAKKDAAQAASLRKANKSLAAAADLAAMREAFKEVSEAAIALASGASRPLNVFKCDMAKARWLQASAETANPYYGKSMLKCGERVGAVPAQTSQQ